MAHGLKEKGLNLRTKYGRELMAVIKWIAIATVAQMIIIGVLALADTQRALDDTYDAWVERGGAATFSIGLLAAALAESILRYGCLSLGHYLTGLLSLVLLFYMAAEHGAILSGAAGEDGARAVPERVILGAIVLGAISVFFTERSSSTKTSERGKSPKQAHQEGGHGAYR